MIDNNKYLEAVMTLLHVDYAKCLLQLRDFKSSIPFPGVWGGFGGELKKGESPKLAGCRELKEELDPDHLEQRAQILAKKRELANIRTHKRELQAELVRARDHERELQAELGRACDHEHKLQAELAQIRMS